MSYFDVVNSLRIGRPMFKTILICCVVVLCGVVWAGSQNTQKNIDLPEQTGEEIQIINRVINTNTPAPTSKVSFNRLDRVLMILESTSDSIGLYDPYDGTFLRNLCKIPQIYGTSATPICATQGPDGKIYASDQLQEAVFMFDTAGTYLGVYADNTDGLDNTRGIAFRGTHLFITNGSPALKTIEMSGPHTVVRNFIQDASDPFDIYFLPNGQALLADIAGSTDNVRLYDTNGVFIRQLFSLNFPEQIQIDTMYPNRFLVAGFSSNDVKNFLLDGTIVRTWPLPGARGVYRLGNGNILGTYGTGTVEIDSATGTILQNEHGGSGRFIEFYHVAGSGISESDNNYRTINLDYIYPNPFNNLTTIHYNLINSSKVCVKIFSCLGSEVRTLVNQNQTSGVYSVSWDGKDNNGMSVPNGIYVCSLRAENVTQRSQLILIK